MSLNDTPSGERIHIGFFGVRNAGKSSVVNRITNQDLSIVSDVKGTTTDAVKKAMELLPLGPVVIIDTPGFDDEGELGSKRIESTKKVLRSCHIAILVTDNAEGLNDTEKQLIDIFKSRQIPYLIVRNKSDLSNKKAENTELEYYVSAKNNAGFEELKKGIAGLVNPNEKKVRLVADFIEKNDIVVLVTPIDSAAPKGRLILPQQQAIRDIIDNSSVAVVVRENELESTLMKLENKVSLVITDSQVFGKVMKLVPSSIALTSFSILMARYKGFLDTAVSGAHHIDELNDGARILISEGCTHHRQCEDIGTVKLPKWLCDYTGKELEFEFSSGTGFPDDLSEYDMVIHCGGCMLNENEMQYRMNTAIGQNVPFTNYGTAIAHINGILKRSTEIIYK